VTLRLLAEVAWQPIGLAVTYGAWRTLGRERAGRAMQALGTAIALVGLAWLPVAAIDLAVRTRHDARLSQAALERAGAIHLRHPRRLVRAIHRLRAAIPEGDTYRLRADVGEVSFWAYTGLLPRVAVGPGGDAHWQIVWNRHHRDAAPAGATEVVPGVWIVHTP
jgi:hypothetical protein